VANDLERTGSTAALTPPAGVAAAADLVERYVYEAGRHLPQATRVDVAEELHSSISDALDARASAAGRAWNEADAMDVLRGLGPPQDVASRYAPPRSLVGPAWYSIFVSALTTVLTVVFFSHAIGLVARIARHGWSAAEAAAAAGRFAWVAFIAAGLVVLVFAVLERVAEPRRREAADWDPRTLPDVPRDTTDAPVAAEAAGDRIWWAIVGLVLVNVFPSAIGIFTGHQYRYTIVPLRDVGVPLPVALLDLYFIGALLLNLVLVRQGQWSRRLRWLEWAVGVAGLACLAVMSGWIQPTRVDGAWVLARGWPQGNVDDVLASMAVLRTIAIGVLRIVTLWQAWRCLHRLWLLVTKGERRDVSA
jgi:hypothetical protein